jgi:hypothetical protein
LFIIRETTLERESRDLVDPVIYQCRKHRQPFLGRKRGIGQLDFAAMEGNTQGWRDRDFVQVAATSWLGLEVEDG